ncbi:hypothetical protein IE53DRAFT_159594 [Violaceomyces palustris]|uniref:Uncharacterized protein n=1 Tax=Violaceomyces palustris TaxID=1673888 RepID=A0ACD0NTR2_9BASI|nr:hypothetical protein IE53DRAFT_159594 [Violaceomyces palustris]
MIQTPTPIQIKSFHQQQEVFPRVQQVTTTTTTTKAESKNLFIKPASGDSSPSCVEEEKEKTTTKTTSPSRQGTGVASEEEEGVRYHGPNYPEDLLPKVPTTSLDSVERLEVDSKTPDNWLERDPNQIRLTGKHPLNCEPPIAKLFQQGFLTPQNLFYVRSHGAVPKFPELHKTPMTSSEVSAESPGFDREIVEDNWRLRVHGLVEREIEFSIQDLKRLFKVVTLPVTLVCAGNRRKEQNVVKKGLGFNWGAAGVSTGLFTGVYLHEVLEYCKPIKPTTAFPSYSKGAAGRSRHVIFEGGDLLPKGKYGTSQRIHHCLDRSKAMMIAWGINGEKLSPDHGFPLRLIVPGQIGGRMVKWLNRIEVSEMESQHHLHFWDNKVLPTQVDDVRAREEEGWWKDPRYIINDLNVNAAICHPDNDQILKVFQDSETNRYLGRFTNEEEGLVEPKDHVEIKGYVYTGGGKRINRVEICFDDQGRDWRITELDHPEDLYRLNVIEDHPFYGTLDLSESEMSYAWSFWSFKVPISELFGCNVISVRAMDEGLAMMPRDMYWNATSMMNNWWFRVKVERQEEEGGSQSLKFLHPTVAGNESGGWMEAMKSKGLNPQYPTFSSPSNGKVEEDSNPSAGGEERPNPSPSEVGEQEKPSSSIEESMKSMTLPEKFSNLISMSQFKEMSERPGAAIFSVHGQVYDGAEFLELHPGGGESITLVNGEDATEDFMAIHSLDGKKQLAKYHIGTLVDEEGKDSIGKRDEKEEKEDPTSPFLEPKKWKKVTLAEKRIISHDSRIFRFSFDQDSDPSKRLLGLPCGKHLFLRVKDSNGNYVQRAYTPFSGDELRGSVEILIKIYFPSQREGGGGEGGEHDGGKMTMLLESLQVGDEVVEVKGPFGSFQYLGDSKVSWKTQKERSVDRFVMIAGGSGITPIWSTLKGLSKDLERGETESDRDHQKVWILDGNRKEEDILAREQLQEVVDSSSGRIKIHHVLSDPGVGESWQGGRGRIDLDLIKNRLPLPSSDQSSSMMALVCGPPAMEKSVRENLKILGWDLEKDVVFF